ncbi:MAG: CBS domain-containing protein, partial [Pseudomonadota bacterium]
MSLEHIMRPEIFVLQASETVTEAAVQLRDRQIGAALVQEAGRVAGIFTERDILTKLIPRRLPPETTTVREIMSKPLITVPVTATLPEALRMLQDNAIRHLPVCDASGNLIGIIGLRDVIKAQMKNLEFELDQRKHNEKTSSETLSQIQELSSIISSIVIGVSSDDHIFLWNAAAEQTFHITSSAVIGKLFAESGIKWDWDI